MSEGLYAHQINEHNPLNIKIEFNINGQRQINPHQIRDKRVIDTSHQKPTLPLFQHPRTPDLAQTDRNTYNKDTEYLQPMDDIRFKRKSKRNSMDINITSRTNQPETSSKSKVKSLMQTQVLKKVDPSKKKRSFSKYEGEVVKKGFSEGASKSAAIEPRTSKKAFINHSLKSIIHKIVHSELSKRTLGTYFSKGRSPYQLQTSQTNGSATNRKKYKKKNLASKSDKEIKAEGLQKQDVIVENLSSLKSMSASVVRSEMDEPEIPYYSKKKGRIHIHTDHSIDLIDQIAFYEKKIRRQDRKKEVVNPDILKDTTQLIQTYIQLMQMNEKSDYRKQSDDELFQESKFEEQTHKQTSKRDERKKIRETLSKQMDNLFEEGEQVAQKPEILSNQFLNKQQKPLQSDVVCSNEKIRPYLSSQIERAGISGQLQRLKLQQLKKQQMEKWGYLIQFIKKNMGTEEADRQVVLNEVYTLLERSKNEMQLDFCHDGSVQKQSIKQIDQQFTVKYSENREENSHYEYYQDSPLKPEEEDEDVASFREQYITEDNEDLKLLNLETISTALKHRKETLLAKQEKELNGLELRRNADKISQKEYEAEKQKINKWTKKELEEISKAKKNIWQGYREARGILDKNIHSRQYQQHTSSGKMMKCLSETYLRKNATTYIQDIKAKELKTAHEKDRSQKSEPYQSDQSEGESESDNSMSYREDYGTLQDEEKSDDHHNPSPLSEPLGGSQELSLQKSEEMEAIKERLLKMKNEHFSGDDNDNISYEQVEKQLQQGYSDEQMAIISKQMGAPLGSNFNDLETKLKYCCAEDKEDIFQFIFLDLCIELYQEPCSENRLMKSINHHIAKAQAQAKKKKGVKTNLNVVKEYLKRFSSFLLRTNRAALHNLSNPMGPSALEMLRYMHDGDYDIKQEEEEAPTFIIPVASFEKFQQSLLPTLQFQQYYDDHQKEEARVGFLKTILHIHNRALFDSINQHLDHQRPFGIWGAPFPWKRAAAFPHAFSEMQLEQKLKKSTEKVIEQCSYVCGLLADKEESLVGNAKISEAYIEQIREDRLSRMLANELVESQERWLFYDDQQTQVLVEMGNYVWMVLLREAQAEILAFTQK